MVLRPAGENLIARVDADNSPILINYAAHTACLPAWAATVDPGCLTLNSFFSCQSHFHRTSRPAGGGTWRILLSKHICETNSSISSKMKNSSRSRRSGFHINHNVHTIAAIRGDNSFFRSSNTRVSRMRYHSPEIYRHIDSSGRGR